MGRRVVEFHLGMTRQPHVSLWLVGREIVDNDVDFAFRIISDDGVHEAQELDPPPPFIVAPDHLAGGDI